MPVLSQIQFKTLFIAVFCSLSFLSACEPNDGGQIKQNQIFSENKLLPTEMWVTDALMWISKTEDNMAAYVLNGALPDFKSELRVFFDSNNAIYKSDVIQKSQMTNALFFENGRLIYSIHGDTLQRDNWIIAYANEKAYAAAKREGDNWIAENPKSIPIDNALINSSKAKSEAVNQKEVNSDFDYRFKAKSERVTRILRPRTVHSFILNVRAGDLVEINLDTDSDDLFFTIEPNNGTNMERQKWRGTALNTGDMTITVFSSESKEEQDYAISVSKVPFDS